MSDGKRYDGKLVLVTGGTTGIGLVAARRLVPEGASVVITGRRAEPGEAAVAALRSEMAEAGGGRARFVPGDVSVAASAGSGHRRLWPRPSPTWGLTRPPS